MVNVCVFGASGTIGNEIVNQLLIRNHEVIAVTRNSSHINTEHPNLTIKEANVREITSIEDIVKSADVIISALGTPIYRPPVCASGVENILAVMDDSQKIVTISAYGANDSNQGFYTKLIRLIIPGHMKDKDRMEELISESGKVYTIIRPTRLKKGKYTGEYQTGSLEIGLMASISIVDVADLVIKSLENHDNEVINISS